MQSCIYEGQVKHSRKEPVLHRFRYRLFMMYLDLAELPKLFDKRWFWSVKRPAIARFRRAEGPPRRLVSGRMARSGCSRTSVTLATALIR